MSETTKLAGSLEREAMLKHLQDRIDELRFETPAIGAPTYIMMGRVEELGKTIEFVRDRQLVCKTELEAQGKELRR